MKARILISILAALGMAGVWALVTRRPEHQSAPAFDSRWLTDESPPVLRMYDVTDLIDAQVEFSRSLDGRAAAPGLAADALVVLARSWVKAQDVEYMAGRLLVCASPTHQGRVSARLAHLRAAIARADGREP